MTAVSASIRPVMYDNAQIAKELRATAQGDSFYGNSLRVAKDLEGVNDIERGLLDRCARRGVLFEDRMRLQDLAIKIANNSPASPGGQEEKG